MENENNDAVRAEPIGNPWREFIENCIGGGNYFRTSEWHALLADLDRLYAKSAAHAAQSKRITDLETECESLSALANRLDTVLAEYESKPAQQPGDDENIDDLFYPPKAMLKREDWDATTRKPKVQQPGDVRSEKDRAKLQAFYDLAVEAQRLHDALCFWLPKVPDEEGPIRDRIVNDAYMLVGYDDMPDKQSAEELGWIKLIAAAQQAAGESMDTQVFQKLMFEYGFAGRIADAEHSLANVEKMHAAYKAIIAHIDAWASRRPAAAPTDANRYACNLATAIWEKHYKADAPQWQVLPDTYGALSQIDNMVTGLSRAAIAAARPSAPVEAVLTIEQIIDIAHETQAAESRDGDYILPIAFARAIEARIQSQRESAS